MVSVSFQLFGKTELVLYFNILNNKRVLWMWQMDKDLFSSSPLLLLFCFLAVFAVESDINIWNVINPW